MLNCPECGSRRVWKDGFRSSNSGQIQRYFCCDCGYRFSNNDFKECQTSRGCQICVSDGEMKNLVKVETEKEFRTSPYAECFIPYILYLKRIGRKETTIETYTQYIQILSKSNLEDPDEIALFIHERWSENSTRIVAVYAYDAYLKSIGKTWNKPKYKPTSKLPFIPTQEELSNAIMPGKQSSITFVRLLYETGCRTNESERVQWDDIDYSRKKIYIRASKKGNARFISVSDTLLNMLNRLPRTNSTLVFRKRYRNARRVGFSKRMKRLARLTGNARYCKIHFHTLRHVFALRTYHRTKNILTVKTLMGHKSLLTTQRYVEIYSQIYADEECNQFITKIAATKEERCELINEGWEFIKSDGDDWYFRKPK